MKVTIRTKSHPEEQTFICSSFEYPTISNEPWFILKDKDGDAVHMFATEDILYVGIDYEEESKELLSAEDKEAIYHKIEALNLGLNKPIIFRK